jgi:integrase
MKDKKTVPYTYRKRDVFYFSRRIPTDVAAHYPTDRIVKCLKTKSKTIALRMVTSINRDLDYYWAEIRIRNLSLTGIDEVKRSTTGSTTVYFSTAVDEYISNRGHDQFNNYTAKYNRQKSRFINLLGDKPIAAYSNKDALIYRDSLLEAGLKSSSTRTILSEIRAVFSHAITANCLTMKNPFSSVPIPNLADTKRIELLTSAQLTYVQKECLRISDEHRLILAILSDTGMRLAEVVGLLKSDIVLDSSHPHIIVRPHKWRRLKNQSSQRAVPLVGSALEAIQTAITKSNSEFCFPHYTSEDKCKSGLVSVKLNKWLRQTVGLDTKVHALRHLMRDRLRNHNAPSELIDQIGGWAPLTTGRRYGQGYSIESLYHWMKKTVHTDLF